ncbi:MAG: hypothetical protein JW936_08625 [Sedimentisphaerales bacterium]|nr:hypothetical protein [Sedimentisphaerales bacterium]
MKKLAKKIVSLLIVVLIILIILGFVVLWHFDSIVRYGTETAGSAALGVPVKVEKAHVGWTAGTIQFDNLNIANPPNFETSHLLNIGNLITTVDLGTITSQEIVVSTVRVENMNIVFEHNGTTSNIQTIIDNIKELQGEEEPEEDKEPSRTIRVDTVELINPSITLKVLPISGQADALTFELGDIIIDVAEMQDSEARAAKVQLVVQEVLVAVLSRALEAVAGELPADIAATVGPLIQSTQEALDGVLQETLNQITDIIGEGGAGLEQAGRNILEGIGESLPVLRDPCRRP